MFKSKTKKRSNSVYSINKSSIMYGISILKSLLRRTLERDANGDVIVL